MDFSLSTKWGILANPYTVTMKCDEVILMKPSFQEKFLRLIIKVPVPQTDTRGRGENPKTRERTLVKELCKITP